MLAIKLVLCAIACILGLVYVIGIAVSATKIECGYIKAMYIVAVVWMAFGEAFFIGYMVKLIGGIR